MKYYLIAGEASGDLHGSNLIKALKERDPNSEFRCWGGDLMEAEGAVLVKHYKHAAIMGFVEVLLNIRTISNNLKTCKEDIINYSPDVLILIDYPGFNFRIAEFAKKRGITTFYYIAPKVWAWKEKRVHKLKAFVDRLFIIFPFEIEYFKKWGIEAVYRGNPLLDSVDNYKYCNESRDEFCKRVNIDSNREFVALLAGSRRDEIKYLLPRMVEVTKRFPNYNFILACAPSIELNYYKKFLGLNSSITLLQNETYSILRHSRASIISSGTASLEAALLNSPQVVCYGVNEISYLLAKNFIKIKYVSLANLIMDKELFKELLQHNCTPDNISNELDNLLNNSGYRENMLKDYANVRAILGESGASSKVAEAMVEELNKLNR